MKKWIVMFVVVILTFAIVIPAFAKSNGPFGGGSGGGNNFGIGTGSVNGFAQRGSRGIVTMVGTIAAIGTNAVTIDVYSGNKLVHPYLGTQVIVTVNPQTRYLLQDGVTTTIISFAALMVGQPVSVNGTLTNTIWAASRITVGASLSCLPK